ncbi:hypothetical protein [Nonomuraea sediminis]|uniref:hypothetical protein n=1 Tax=Nonomuraea sediminis TaxID=2835864 RepID=UPI001BDD47C9|nr:hypothetical protein [Nonomuraea sediminis]
MTPQEDFDRIGTEMADLGVVIAKVFGKPSYKAANGKAFACLFQEGLACRLVQGSAEHAEALALEGATLFDPSERHRPMKDWVSVPHAHAGRWQDYAETARERVMR